MKTQTEQKDMGLALGSRKAVFEYLEQLLSQPSAAGISVVVLEVHRFRQVNNGLGPRLGDEILERLALRLRNAVDSSAGIGQMGGDGFAVILPGDQLSHDLVDHLLDLCRRPFSIAGKVVVLEASAGVASSQNDGSHAEALLRAADIALHQAIQQSESVVYFEEAMLDQASSQHILENDLRYSILISRPELLTAVAAEQFDIHYQPQISRESGQTNAVEALLRWNHPRRGRVDPTIFIPLAEEIGVIEMLGAWILQRACKDIVRMRQLSGNHDLGVSVNVSPKQLKNQGRFLQQLDQALSDSGLPAEALTLEITESTALEINESEVEAIIERGCSLALDDFGTGFSSLNVLRNLPLKSAKMDRTFVSGLFAESAAKQRKDEQMTRAFQRMCHELNISTTIEGVESRAQFEFLSDLGCDAFQGFYFSQPISFSRLLSFLVEGQEPQHA